MQVELLKKLLFEMMRVRMVEETIAERYSEQEMRCPVHLSVGQEAPAVGISAALEKEDFAFSAHRSHAHYLAKGGNLKAMLCELYGRADGCCRGKGGSMHLIDRSCGFMGAVPILASSIPIGVGAAFGSILKKKPCVSVIFFGDGALEEGTFTESLNFAILKNLPVIFVCENNAYSVFSHISDRRKSHLDIYQVIRGYGITSVHGDGNDILEVYLLAQEAVTKAKSGNGPTFIELETYRTLEHCGPSMDDDLGYRPKEEVEEWRKRCPILRMTKQLKDKNQVSDHEIKFWTKEIKKEIEAAFQFAKASPFPHESHLYDVFAT
jgi:TPP-dependent pyruvate/acetoin dehydrogenase alpha subunit